METMSVREARQPESIGQPGAAARLDPQPPRFQGRLQLSRAQRRLVPGQYPGRGRRGAGQLRSEIKHLSAGCSVTVEGTLRASPGDGQATEVQAAGDHGPRLGRSGNLSAAKEAALVRVLAHDRPSAAADQHVRRDRPRAELRQPLDPRFFPGAGLSLRPHADHHRQRLRRGRRDVQGHDARPGQGARGETGGRLSKRIFSTGPPI